MHQRLNSFFLLIFFIVSLLSPLHDIFASEADETYFIATAYYSPLEGQSRYTTGSYWGDVRLNGEGHTTASGTGVFPGLLAGPANYPFGTKIHFEGYGVGSIEDRGGAIVKAGERGHSYDRIDIWMGYGDAGLERALSWGTRKIKGKIVVPSTDVSLNFGESPLGNLRKLNVNPESSNNSDVRELQGIFNKIGIYNGLVDGNYSSIEETLIDFQLRNNIISSRSDEAAGWYGPSTIRTLRNIYGASDQLLQKEDLSIFQNTVNPEATATYKIILDYGDLQVKPESESEEILQLQSLMRKLGEYTGPSDGLYSSIEKPLLNYQLKIGLINDKKDWGAGYFGNKTKSAMWKYYESIKEDLPSEIQDKNIVLTSSTVEVKEPFIIQIQNTYSLLSNREKYTLELAVVKLREKLRKEELSGKGSAFTREEQLKKAISLGIERFEDKKTQEKLGYILEVLNSTNSNN